MKPKILKVIGINSFNEVQTIDFSNLIKGGIFGIFGDTGSGKSTIIDSITLALYGKIVRYNGKVGNGDFLNLNRNNAKVEFSFSIKEAKDEITYLILRQFKRDNKGSIKSDLVRFSVLSGESYEIISDKKKDIENKITEIIGLSYEDFTKAVILPQGKFSDFLMLENIDKRKMLQRIFGLEKYGDKLQNKINEKKNLQQNIVEKIKDKIEFYGDVSKEDLNKRKDTLLEEEKNLNNIKIKLNNILEREVYLKNILNLKEELLEYEKKLKTLLKYEKEFINFREEFEKSLESDKIEPYIREINKLENENDEALKNIDILKAEINLLNKDYQQVEILYNNVKYKKENEKPILDKIKIDLENCINLLNENEINKNEIENISRKLEKIYREKDDLKVQINSIEDDKTFIKGNIDSIDKFKQENKIDYKLKNNLKSLLEFQEKENNLRNEINICLENQKSYEKDIRSENQELETMEFNINELILNISKILFNNKINIEENIKVNLESIKYIEKKYLNIDQDIKDINMQIKLQENKKFIKELTMSLQQNLPCPICGSKKHPNPSKIVLDVLIETLEKDKQSLKEKLNSINEEKNLLLSENIILQKYLDDIDNEIKSIKYVESQKLEDKSFIFNKEDIFKNLQQYKNEINNLKEKKAAKLSNIKNNINLLKNNIGIKIKLERDLQFIIKNVDNLKLNIEVKNFKEEYENILNIEKVISENNEKLIKFREKLEEINDRHNKIFYKRNSLEKEESSLKAIKEEKVNTINDLDAKIKDSLYNNYLKTYLNEVSIQIDSIINDEKELPKKLNLLLNKVYIQIDSIINNEQELSEKFNSLLEYKNKKDQLLKDNIIEKNTNEKRIKEKREQVHEMINKSSFNNEEDVLLSFRDKDRQCYCKEKIKSYKDKLYDYSNNLNRIKEEFKNINHIKETEKLKIEEIKRLTIKNEILKIFNEKCSIENEYQKKLELFTKIKLEIGKIEEVLKKVGSLVNDMKKENKKLDLLKELSKINQGGLFVEYVANSQLRHIVFDASKRLENMSNNKYSLELLDTNFVIKDHYNGGILRSPRSLSGGEVFMASLSLALALSSKIQLKNKSPLEVFFLDEGFGTLDNNLIDTVINTLEQLHSRNIGVGIITHVDEIKNRVQNRIIVKKSENGTIIEV